VGRGHDILQRFPPEQKQLRRDTEYTREKKTHFCCTDKDKGFHSGVGGGGIRGDTTSYASLLTGKGERYAQELPEESGSTRFRASTEVKGGRDSYSLAILTAQI